MILDKTSGVIKFNDIEIGPMFSLLKIDLLANQYHFVEGVNNANYKSYSLHGVENGEFTLGLMFYYEKLFSLNIALGKNYNFPPFQISSAERNILREKLQLLGGANTFDWGSIQLSEDIKGGIISILIKYK